MRKDFDRNETPKLTKIAKFLFILIQHMKLAFAINSNFNAKKKRLLLQFDDFYIFWLLTSMECQISQKSKNSS